MPKEVARDELRRLVFQGATLAEVLPRPEYEWAHLAGAIHLPLKQLTPQVAGGALRPGRPVVVYCNDLQCDMSPRAAWYLEHLGYGPRYDYVAGKMDWLSFNLAHEGTAHLVGDDLITEIAACRLDERLADVQSRYGEAPASCVVLHDSGVVMGVIDQAKFSTHPGTRAEEAMAFGITTVRPAEDLKALLPRMGGPGPSRAQGAGRALIGASTLGGQ